MENEQIEDITNILLQFNDIIDIYSETINTMRDIKQDHLIVDLIFAAGDFAEDEDAKAFFKHLSTLHLALAGKYKNPAIVREEKKWFKDFRTDWEQIEGDLEEL